MTEEQIRQLAQEARQITIARFSATRSASLTLGANLDKTVIALSGGALVFSMTLVNTIAPAKLLWPVLVSSWVAFALSIIAVIFATRRQQSTIHENLKEDAQLLASIDEAEADAVASGKPFRLQVRVSKDVPVTTWNNMAVVAFLAGVILLGIFVIYNLLHC